MNEYREKFMPARTQSLTILNEVVPIMMLLMFSGVMMASKKPALQTEVIRPTDRELEVLKLRFSGFTGSQVSKIIEITLPTVHHHEEAARRKLEARNLTEALITCLKKRYISIDELPTFNVVPQEFLVTR